MKLENEFTVPAPIEQAWDVLLDIERVAPCLPGATLEGVEDDAHRGTMTIKVGPITSRYKGTVRIEETDEQARRAVLRAQAREGRGQGTAAATITSTMEEVEGGTRVRVETEMRVTGPAAQFGRGVMQEVSAKLMSRFADCLAGEIAAPPAATPQPEAAAPAPTAAPPPGPAGDSAEAAARTEPAPAKPAAPAEPPRAPAEPAAERRVPDVLDLGEASREAVLKRVAPVAAGLVAAIAYLAFRRRRR